MFTVEQRDRVRERLLELAESDTRVAAAALEGWTELVHREFTALHHGDLPYGSSIYRVFLLPDWLELDIAFTPAADFSPRGPKWRTVFGDAGELTPSAPPHETTWPGLAGTTSYRSDSALGARLGPMLTELTAM
jgi:hypothetical protein